MLLVGKILKTARNYMNPASMNGIIVLFVDIIRVTRFNLVPIRRQALIVWKGIYEGRLMSRVKGRPCLNRDTSALSLNFPIQGGSTCKQRPDWSLLLGISISRLSERTFMSFFSRKKVPVEFATPEPIAAPPTYVVLIRLFTLIN